MRKTTLGLLLLLCLPLAAVTPQFWEIRTYDEFRRGKLSSVSITGDDELVLAPKFETIFNTEQPIVFSAVADSRGNVFVGTGHDGKIFRIDATGKGTLWADLAELDVLALALDRNDVLYAASSPDGKVYRVAAEGKADVFFKPDAKYIWSIAFDPQGRLYVATGDKGVIYRVTADGKSESFYDTDETHVISMVLDKDGNVIAGGDPKGYIYRISPEGRAFVLYDSGLREVRSLAIDAKGSMFAAILGGRSSLGGGATAVTSADRSGGLEPTVTVTVGGMAQTVDVVEPLDQPAPNASRSEPRRSSESSNQSVIVEIQPDGVVNTLWRSRDEMVFSLLPRRDKILFSTGTKGRIYALNTPRNATLLVESTEEQTTRLIESGNRVIAASSNAGKIMAMTDALSPTGTYESPVKDTDSISSWGKMTWKAQDDQQIEFHTRSGNTSSPDKTWSDWVRVPGSGLPASPKARFVQWKATLKADAAGKSPLLASLKLPYLQQNFRPEVNSVDVLNSGLALIKVQTFGTAGNTANADAGGVRANGRGGSPVRIPPRRQNMKGAQSFQWAAVDRNNDVLTYDLYYRGEAERNWKVLKQGLEDAFFTIDSDTLPDGSYELRVVASDSPTNPATGSLQGEMTSRPFTIDNTSPEVNVRLIGVERGRARVAIDTTDRTSTLNQAEVSTDTGEWRTVFPQDGIIDSKTESFDWLSGDLTPGEHVIAFRIYDQNDNVGMGKVVVRVP